MFCYVNFLWCIILFLSWSRIPNVLGRYVRLVQSWRQHYFKFLVCFCSRTSTGYSVVFETLTWQHTTLREASGCSGPNRLQWKAARSSSGRIWFPAWRQMAFRYRLKKEGKVEVSLWQTLQKIPCVHVRSSPRRAAKHGRCCVLSPSCLAASDSRYWCVVRFLPFQLSLSACDEK